MSPLEQFLLLERKRAAQRFKLYSILVGTGLLLILLLGSFIGSIEHCDPEVLPPVRDTIYITQIDTVQSIDTVFIEVVDCDDLLKRMTRYRRERNECRDQLNKVETDLATKIREVKIWKSNYDKMLKKQSINCELLDRYVERCNYVKRDVFIRTRTQYQKNVNKLNKDVVDCKNKNKEYQELIKKLNKDVVDCKNNKSKDKDGRYKRMIDCMREIDETFDSRYERCLKIK